MGAPEESAAQVASFAIEDLPRSADSIQALGEAAYWQGEIDGARALFRHALVRAHAESDSGAVAEALTWIAQASWRLGDYEESRRLGEEGLGIKLRSGDRQALFRSYNVLGLLAWNEGRYHDATELLGKAAAAADASGDASNLLKVSNNLGNVFLELGRFDEARERFRTAIDGARTQGEARIEALTLISLAMLEIRVGNPRSAVAYLEESRPILLALSDVVGQQHLMSRLGAAYAAIGAPGRAIAYLDSAAQGYRANNLRQEEAIVFEQLAELHSDAGNFQRALQLFAQARAINEEMGLSDELAIDLRSEAAIHRELGNRQLAIRNTMAALRIHRQIESPLEVVNDLVQLAELALEVGDPADAETYLDEATRLSAELGVSSARLSVTLTRARIAERDGDPARVLQLVTEAEADIARGGYVAEWEAEALRARAYALAGDLDAAAAAGQKAIAAVERVRRRFGSGALRAAYLTKRARAYSDQVSLLLATRDEEGAFRVADALRGRVLRQQLASVEGDAQAGRAARDLTAGEGLLSRIDDLVVLLDEFDRLPPDERTGDTAAESRRLFEELENARSEYEAVLIRAEERDPRGSALLGGTRLDVAAVRQGLLPGEALLEYLVTPERLVVFVLTRDTLRHFSHEISSEVLASRVRVARELIGHGGAGVAAGREALERLYGILIGPPAAAGALSGLSRLIVVPHAELTYLPFAALRDEETGRYLVEDYVITRLPSAAALAALRGERSVAPVRSQIAAAGFAPFPSDLPASVAEIGAFGEAVPSARVYRGSQATEEDFRAALQAGAVVHAATHGILNARNPMFSRIELAPGRGAAPAGSAESASSSQPESDGRLEVHEVMGFTVRSPLVFLSGCETGVGAAWSTSFGRGDDYATLAQAFLYAGARNVIATLWPVRDEGAAAFASAFYSELGTSDPALTLARAQRAMIRSRARTAPFYWAAYVLSGEGRITPPAGSDPSVRSIL